MRSYLLLDRSNIPNSLVHASAEQEHIAITRDLTRISEKIYKGNKITIDDISDYYHGQSDNEVRYSLRKLYKNKCAYCEAVSYTPDVEHYRPKKEVKGQQPNKHGYYWLCYEWTNLLPACYECNSRRGKGNKFPITSTNQRVVNPSIVNKRLNFDDCKLDSQILGSEVSLLLHPEIDNVEEFLRVQWNGRLIGLDGRNGKGNTTIRTCDLNRGNLIYARKAIIDEAVKDILSTFLLHRRNKIATENIVDVLKINLDHIFEKEHESKPYSLVTLNIRTYFQNFINSCLRSLNRLEKDVLLKVFQDNYL